MPMENGGNVLKEWYACPVLSDFSGCGFVWCLRGNALTNAEAVYFLDMAANWRLLAISGKYLVQHRFQN